MKKCNLVPEIQDYIDLVRSGEIEVCIEQLLLVDYVEKCFKEENIFVDEEELHTYLSYQKYFPYDLYEWEVFIFTLHNCTYSSPGILRWPDLFVLVGRGAGKNGYLSFEDFCLISDNNKIKNYDIDICANSEDQARTSFDDIYNVLEDNKTKLSKHFYWNKELIYNRKTKSKLRFRTSNASTKDGGRPGKVDFDEYHEYKDYKAINVFITGLGKKKNPRTTITTTNGYVRGGPLDKMIDRAENILKGAISDNGMLPFICKLDDEKEVDNPKKWDKANPSLHYPEKAELRRQIEKEYNDYKEDPIINSSFMTKRMNIPKSQNADKEVTSWDNILATNQPIPDLESATCYGAVDYAKTTDFVAAGLLFKFNEKYVWITHSWICTKCLDLPRIKAPLNEWEEAGHLTFVDDVEIHPSIVAEWFRDMGRHYNITKLFADNYRFTLLKKAFKEVGFDTDKGGANNVTLIRPSDIMYAYPLINSAFTNKNIIWGDNPLMRWYINNTCLHMEKHENYTFEKIEPKSRKTDGFMAFVAGMCGEAKEGLPDSSEKFDISDFKVYAY